MHKELYDAREKWHNLGLELKINPCDLDVIRMKYRNDPDECFKDSLSMWLKRGDRKPTWGCIVSALKSPTVGYMHLSITLQQRYWSNSGTNHRIMDSPQPTPQHQKDITSGHFECPCGKCDLLVYLDKGCPIAGSGPYPYLPLDLNEMSENHREDLIQKLTDETAEIIQCFADLLTETGQSMKHKEISVAGLVKVALDFGAYKSGRNQVPLLNNDRTELKKATSIDDVFIVLQKHVSFFNYEILYHIVRHLGDDSDRTNFENYLCKFKVYCERKVFEVPRRVFDPCDCQRTDSKLFIVIGTQDLFDKLADVKAAQRKIASLLNLKASTVKLKQIDIGCVILVFSIPRELSDMFPLEPATSKYLKACGYMVYSSEEQYLDVQTDDDSEYI